MVYMMSSTRAGRPNKEKAKANHNSKSDGASVNQKPTPEQMRLASSLKSSDEHPEMEDKIQQLAELTGRSKDEACFALHDCDYDLDRAAVKLFENEVEGEWQEMKTKKKKNQLGKSESEPIIQEEAMIEIQDKNQTFDKDYNNDRNYDRSGSAPRGRRNDRAPPRFQKAGRGRNINDDDRDGGDSQSRDRGGRGRGRGGSSRGRGRGRGGIGAGGGGAGGGIGGAGGRKGDFTGGNRDRGMNYDNGPGMAIDTWTNDVAEEPRKESSFGTWGEMASTEDWTGDEWQGSLDKTTVFTSSVNNEASKVFSDNDAKMFSVTSIETQAFNNTLSNSLPSPPQLDSFQHTAPSIPDPIQQLTAPKPIGQNSVGQGAIGQPAVIGSGSAIGQGSSSMSQNSLGQRLDLGMLLSGKSEYQQPNSVEAVTQQTAELTKETADFMAQFQKQATETIKNVVGIGSSSSQNTAPIGSSSLSGPQATASSGSQPPVSVQQTLAAAAETLPTTSASIQPSQAKPQRPPRSTTKLPPPSKIPASAVVMPGAGNKFGTSVDVEFGCFSESPGGFSFGSISGVAATTESNTYSSSAVNAAGLGNHLSQVNKSEPQQQPSVMTSSTSSVTSQQQQTVSSILESMTQQNSQSPRPTVAYTPTTPPKNYSQSTKISSPPEPIPFPGRKSPYQPAEQPASVQLSNYSQSSYNSSAYPSSAYKPSPAIISSAQSAVGSNHGSSSGGSSLSSSNPLQNYQSSSFQSQQPSAAATATQVGSSSSSGGYTGGASTGTSSLYPSSVSTVGVHTPQSSSFQSQNASYTGGNQSVGSSTGSIGGTSNNTAGVATYQQQSSYLTRDSQSAPAFQSSVSQTSGVSAYQSSLNQSSGSGVGSGAGSSAYQRDLSQNNASSVGQTGYGSASSQSAYSSVVSVAQQQQPPSASSLSTNKSSSLNESLSKLTVNEAVTSVTSSLEEQLTQTVTGQYDTSAVSAATGSVAAITNLHTNPNPTSSSISTGSVTLPSASVALGITNNINSSVGVGGVVGLPLTAGLASLSNTATSVSVSKSALPMTTKAPVNLPPGIPPIMGHGQTNYMIGQPGFPIAFGLQQHPMYSYEDLIHQRMPLHTTALTGLDQSKLAAAAAAVNYTDANKLNRIDAQSPVNAQSSQQQQTAQQQQTQQQAAAQQQQTQHQQTAQQQTAQQQAANQQSQSAATHSQQAAAFPMHSNPAAGLPGYYNYYMGGLPQTAYPYQTHMIPLNNLMTNTGVTSANAQFQKTAYNYGSAANYDSLSGASHDFSKAFGVGVTQSQNKVSATGASMSVSSNSDLSSYQKQTAYDKSGFAGGTPPPFSTLPPGLPTGTQTGQGQLGGGTPFMQAQYMPTALAAAAAGHPSQMLHQLHQAQDTSGGSGRVGGQQNSSQPKSLMTTKPNNYSAGYHWGGN